MRGKAMDWLASQLTGTNTLYWSVAPFTGPFTVPLSQWHIHRVFIGAVYNSSKGAVYNSLKGEGGKAMRSLPISAGQPQPLILL